MKKTLIAFTAASALAVGTMAVPQKAEAYPWWVVPSIVGAAVVGGAVIAGTHGAYAQQPYGPYARGSVSVAPRGCYLQERPALWGGFRYVEVCR